MPIKVSAKKSLRTQVYNKFLGVDFSQDAMLVDEKRSPDAVNMISDKSGMPEKRMGYKTLFSLGETVYCIANGEIEGEKTFLAHCGDKLYRFDSQEPVLIHQGLNRAKSSIFFTFHEDKTKAFILTGREYLVYDGSSVKDVSEVAYIPTTLIAKTPDGGGTALEAINLLQPKRTEKFAADGTKKIYYVFSKDLDETEVVIQQKISESSTTTLKEGTNFTVDRALGKITFTIAPAKSSIIGEDNIFITYAKTDNESLSKIKNCNKHTFFGMGSDTRVFVTGNENYPSYDWFCHTNDPTYFGDTNFSIVGSSNTKIMGYGKIGSHLIVVKEDNSQDTTIFLRSPYFDSDEKLKFTLQGCITGIGAISPYSFAQLVDEPLFLSNTGVYAITSNAITAERTVQNRSYFIDNKLIYEDGIENAVAFTWQGYYLISVNSNVYLLDSRQKSNIAKHDNFVYEAYFWQGINANCFMSWNDLLYFGDNDGNICVFKSDIFTMERFSDDDKAINAVWSTKMDDDALGLMSKTLSKKGCVLTLKPVTRSSVTISAKTLDNVKGVEILKHTCDILNLSDVNFNRYTFEADDNARTIVIKHKIKNYTAVQFIFSNKEKNEGFGVFSLIKCFTPTNYVKGDN